MLLAALVGLVLGTGGTLAGVGLSRAAEPGSPKPDRGSEAPAAKANVAAVAAAAATAADCGQAVRRADASLKEATRVEKSLAEHTSVMNQLSAGKISPGQALNMGMPSLISGARFSAVFDTAYADYLAVVKRCQLR